MTSPPWPVPKNEPIRAKPGSKHTRKNNPRSGGSSTHIARMFLTGSLVQQIQEGNVVAPLVGGSPDQALDHRLRELEVLGPPQLLVQLRLQLQALQLLPERHDKRMSE